jgi:hypothetical protein
VAEVAGHSSAAELGERFRAAADARSARHVQAIWLLAKGHAAAEVASTTAFGVRRPKVSSLVSYASAKRRA